MDAIVFDLDETLLDTSMLRADREQRRWRTLAGRLDEVRPYRHPHSNLQAAQIPACARSLGLRVGVLTHGPRWYAERLLEAFNIRYDALITGSDGYPQKPDPTSLRAIAADLGVAVEDCVMIGDDAADIGAGQNAGAVSVGVAWSGRAPAAWRRCWPDLAAANPDRALDAIRDLQRRSPFCEAVLAGNTPLWHWGSLVRLGDGLFAAGRYFSVADRRHPTARLSRLIIAGKQDAKAAQQLSEALGGLAERCWAGSRVDLVTSVPPKPGEQHDRFGPVRAVMAKALEVSESGRLLRQLFDDADYKHQPASARPARAQGRFRSRALHGERVLLLDDVITSGGQAGECRRVMLEQGASSVTVLAFAVTQDPLPRNCPDCGGLLRLVTSGYKPFIGCSNYYPLGCRYKEQAPDV